MKSMDSGKSLRQAYVFGVTKATCNLYTASIETNPPHSAWSYLEKDLYFCLVFPGE